MLTLVHVLVTFLVIAPKFSVTLPDPCREARTLEPLITVGLIHETAGFCPTTPTSLQQCCSANAWTTLFPQSWTRLANTFNTKLVSMELGLKKGLEEVKALNCPSGSDLQATTLSALGQLGTSKWVQLLNTTTSPECRLKVVQSVICPGTCDPNMPLKLPCRNLCLNILRGCVGDLAGLAEPWKKVMGSVRTAIRLLATPVNSGCTNQSAVESLLHSLLTWREPLNWLDNGCEELPRENCYNGRDVAAYSKGVSALGSSSNPEFPFSELPPGGVSLNVEVEQFKSLIQSVDAVLSHHWPRVVQNVDSSSSSSPGHLLSEDFGGSGDDDGSSHRFLNTDDEDLLDPEFGSGSGDGEGEDGDFGRFNEDIDLLEASTETTPTRTSDPVPKAPPDAPSPPSGSAGVAIQVSLILLSGAIVLSSSILRIR